jgi:hypothetical protein
VLAFTSAHTANKMGSDNMHSYRLLSMFQGNLMLPFFYCSAACFGIYDHLHGAHEPTEDGRKYGPKHVGATALKMFLKCF